MKPRTVLLLVVFGLLGLFALLNWSTISTPAPLNLVVAQVDAPLGVVLLMVIGLLTLIFMLLVAKAETTALLEGRRLLKELEQQRKLADSAEESRFRALQDYLQAELPKLRRQVQELARERSLPSLPQ